MRLKKIVFTPLTALPCLHLPGQTARPRQEDSRARNRPCDDARPSWNERGSRGTTRHGMFIGECTRIFQKVREDQKIDLVLQKPGYYEVDRLSEMIIDELKKNNGYLKISDKSPAEKIKKVFGISKKTYKKAIGALYKKRQIFIDEEGIRLMK